MPRFVVFPVVAFLLLLALSACSGSAGKPLGFLSRYDGFQLGPAGGVAQLWTPRGLQDPAALHQALGGYDKVIIDPVWVSLGNRAVYDGLEPEVMQALANQLRQNLIGAVIGRFKPANEAGPKTLRISAALTGVMSPSRILAQTTTKIPETVGINTVARLTESAETSLSGARLELVVADAETGEALLAAIDGPVLTKPEQPAKPLEDQAASLFQSWAGHLRVTLN